jgi:hypothetical protein
VVGALVVAGCDGSELLEATEEAFDPVALLVGIAVVGDSNPAATSGGDDDSDASLAQRLGEVVGIVSAVGDQTAEAAAVQEAMGGGDVGGLSGRERDVDDAAERIDECVDLGAQSASRTAESLPIRGPPFAPAAC